MKGIPVPEATLQQILSLYRQSVSGRKIAAQLGLSHSTVHRLIASNTVRITNRKQRSKEPQKSISSTAQAVLSASSKHVFTPFTPPPDAPVCNATSVGIYRGSELSYRQPARH